MHVCKRLNVCVYILLLLLGGLLKIGCCCCCCLAALKEQDGDLSQVEVDKMARLVRNVGAKVPADDAVPGGVVLLVELLLYIRGYVLFDIVFLDSLSGTVDCVLLHLLGHVSVLDNSLSVRHCGCCGTLLVL